MHRRVRWENVIRVVGATVLVAVVVAWPRLAPPEPRLPATEATPLAGDEPIVAPTPAVPQPAARAARRGPARGDGARSRAVKGGRPRTKDRPRTRRGRPRATDGRSGADERGSEASGADRGGPETSGDGPVTNGGGSAPVAASPAPPSDPAQTEFGFEGG
jgi:hypothetical protein